MYCVLLSYVVITMLLNSMGLSALELKGKGSSVCSRRVSCGICICKGTSTVAISARAENSSIKLCAFHITAHIVAATIVSSLSCMPGPSSVKFMFVDI